MSEQFIVTGGAGFIGSNLVAALNARGHEDIVVVDRLDAAGMKQRNLDAVTYGDYVDKTEFRERFRAGDVDVPVTVFHLGACSSTMETDEDYLRDNNVDYTRELCEWALGHGTRFIYASSAATYGDGSLGYGDAHDGIPSLQPLNAYGMSKQLFDMWALETGMIDRIVGLKYFNVYGPREDHKGDMRSIVNKAYAQILETDALGLFRSYQDAYADGEQMRDFIYVRDAVAVTLFFHDHPDRAGIFNCGTGQARTWVDLGRAIFAGMDREPNIHFIDMPESIREKYQYFTEAEISKLRGAGYDTPFTSIEDGVRDYVRSDLSIRHGV